MIEPLRIQTKKILRQNNRITQYFQKLRYCYGDIILLNAHHSKFFIQITTIAQNMGCSQSQKQTDNEGLMTKPHVFFLLGGPGSGKGTQSQNLVRDYKFKHLSTGDLLREEQQKGGELAQTIANYISEGKLLPSSIVVRLLMSGIQTYGNRRYIFDGFPRNKENLEEFYTQMADKVVIRNLIYFDCPSDVMIERVIGRSLISGRSDDNPETMKKRLQTFQKETLPIVKIFESRNNCIKIDATKSRQEVYQQIKEELTEANVFPPSPAHMHFVLGGPGSGKGTQCAILVKKYGFIHLSTGDLLRDQVKTGSLLGKEIDSVIKQGKLVSSELMVQLVQSQIEKNNFRGRYLLDGFPRGQQNMDVWERVMSKWVDLKSAIYFECNQTELIRRLVARGKTSGRSDDTAQIIGKRLQVFNENNKPVVDHYTKIGKLFRFDAMRSIDVITKDLEDHLESLGVFPRAPLKPTTFPIFNELEAKSNGQKTQDSVEA